HRLLGLLGLVGIRSSEAMTGTFHGKQLRFNISSLEPIHEPDCLLMGYIGVLGAVDAKRRRRTRCYPIKRTGNDMLVPFLLEITAQKQGQHLGSINALTVGPGEIAGSVVIDHTLDAAGLILMATRSLECLHIPSYAQELRQVTASR